MTARDQNEDSTFSGLQELDRIVMQVISAIRDGGDCRDERQSREKFHSDDNVIYNDEWSGNEREVDAESYSVNDREPFQERFDKCFQPIDGDLADLGDLTDTPEQSEQQGPLSETEQEFVRRTVSWLKRRDNKDIILDQIWRLLMQDAGFDVEAIEQREGDNRDDPGQGVPNDTGSQPIKDVGQGLPADD